MMTKLIMIKRIRLNQWLRQPDTSDVMSQIKISGDTDLQHKIRTLCLKYRDIFSNELPAAPARIPEFTLDVQKEKWEVAKNSGR